MTSSFSALPSRWCLWELRPILEGSPADLDASVHNLGSFGTLDEFWAMWSRLPRVNDLFCDASSVFRKGVVYGDSPSETTNVRGEASPAVLIDGYAVFREGVKPLWEDARNARGGEWSCRKGIPLAELAKFWDVMVFTLLAEEYGARSHSVVGARVVDKTCRGSPQYRLEVWFDEDMTQDGSRDVRDTLVASLRAVDINPSLVPLFSYRPHVPQ